MPYTLVILTPTFPGTIFLKLMYIATKCVQFSVKIIMYLKFDGNVMGSPLDAAMANIFIGFQKEKLCEITDKPLFYVSYVDDMFAIFSTRSES